MCRREILFHYSAADSSVWHEDDPVEVTIPMQNVERKGRKKRVMVWQIVTG